MARDHLKAAGITLFIGTVMSIYTEQGADYTAYRPRLTYNVKRDDYPPLQKRNFAPRYAITYVTTPGYAPYVYNRYAAKPRHYYENHKTGIVLPQSHLYAEVLPQYASQERYDSREKYAPFKLANYEHKKSARPYVVRQSNFQSVPVALQPIRYKQASLQAAPLQARSMEVFAKSSPHGHSVPHYRETKKCYQCAWSPSKTDYITLKDQKVAVASRGGWDKCKGPFSQHEAKSYGVDVWECQGNCYLRVDHNGNFFRGCYKGEYGVDQSKLGCNYQANSLYCFCDSDRCNNGPLPRHKIYS